MKIDCKNIIINYEDLVSEKICKACGRNYNKSGIIIMKNSICNNCVQDIVSMEVTDQRYDTLKERIKSIWKNSKR